MLLSMLSPWPPGRCRPRCGSSGLTTNPGDHESINGISRIVPPAEGGEITRSLVTVLTPSGSSRRLRQPDHPGLDGNAGLLQRPHHLIHGRGEPVDGLFSRPLQSTDRRSIDVSGLRKLSGLPSDKRPCRSKLVTCGQGSHSSLVPYSYTMRRDCGTMLNGTIAIGIALCKRWRACGGQGRGQQGQAPRLRRRGHSG